MSFELFEACPKSRPLASRTINGIELTFQKNRFGLRIDRITSEFSKKNGVSSLLQLLLLLL
jgi:hypothetical protein